MSAVVVVEHACGHVQAAVDMARRDGEPTLVTLPDRCSACKAAGAGAPSPQELATDRLENPTDLTLP